MAAFLGWLLCGLCLAVVLLLSLWRSLRKSLWVLTSGGKRSGNSPFRTVFPPCPAELVTSHSARDGVLKQSFSAEKIPESLDAVVIGKPILHAAGNKTSTVSAQSVASVFVHA